MAILWLFYGYYMAILWLFYGRGGLNHDHFEKNINGAIDDTINQSIDLGIE